MKQTITTLSFINSVCHQSRVHLSELHSQAPWKRASKQKQTLALIWMRPFLEVKMKGKKHYFRKPIASPNVFFVSRNMKGTIMEPSLHTLSQNALRASDDMIGFLFFVFLFWELYKWHFYMLVLVSTNSDI